MKVLVLTGLAALGLVSTAFATTTDQLKVCINNASCITVTDPGPGNSITYSNLSYSGWSIFAEVGLSGATDSVQPALDLSSLTATCKTAGGCGTNVLEVYYSDINFNQVTSGWVSNYSATITGSSKGTTSQYGWVDTSNTIFGTPAGGAVPVNGPYTNPGGSGIVTGGPSTTATPYSVTIEDVFSTGGTTSSSGVTFSTDGALSGVPEPGAIILFGTLVALCASRLRRRNA